MGVCLVNFLYFFSFFIICQTLKVIPERVTLDYVNTTHADNVKVTVRRYKRNGDYYFNIEGDIKHTWGNNVSFDIILFEFLHNEYKRTFIEFHFDNGCDFMNNDQYIGNVLKTELGKLGHTCPVPAGHYALSNLSLPVDQFPYVWPFERAKALATVSCHKRQVNIGIASLYMRFEQKLNRG